MLCMFMHALRQWSAARDREDLELLNQLGVDLDEMRRLGPAGGLGVALSQLKSSEEAITTVETFLDAHPQLQANLEARFLQARAAALDLLRREDVQSLLLDDDEVYPWLPVLSERISADPDLLAIAQGRKEPSQTLRAALLKVLRSVAEEMSAKVFTGPRLRRLQRDICLLDARLKREGKDETLATSGLLMAAGGATPADEENPVLYILCLRSLFRAMRKLNTMPET